MCRPRLAILIGVVGGVIACGGIELLNCLHIDDPVGVVPVHLFCGIWSLVAAGLFTPQDDFGQGYELYGLTQGGGISLLLVQLLAAVCILCWCALFSVIVLLLLSCTIGLRLSYHEELLGADMVEHNIGERMYDKARGKLISRPKWLKRLESQGIVKRRRSSIREAEHVTDSASKHERQRSATGQKLRKRRQRRRRIPSMKIFASPLTKMRAPPRRRSCNSCHAVITRAEHDDFMGIHEMTELENHPYGPPFGRRGARRVHGSPLKWSEVLGVSQERINDIELSQGYRDCANTIHTKYMVISRDKATQTDERFLLEDQQRSFINIHRRDIRIARQKKTLDAHVWESLYEHMV